MKHLPFRTVIAAAALAATAFAGSASAQAIISTVDAPAASIPGLTGFNTTGAAMTGLTISATFSSGLSETRSWAATGATSGGVMGTGWALSLTGDSFNSPWNFEFFDDVLGRLDTLVLDGSTGLTVFDRTDPSLGTPGSAAGRDFSFASGTCGTCKASVVYSGVTSIGAAAAVGDLWQTLTIGFALDAAPRSNWSFLQDTDNDSRFTPIPAIPEPETYALMLAGLGVMGWLGRRRRKATA